MRSNRWISAALVVVGLFAAKTSFAFCRTTTCQHCAPPDGGCVTEGIPVFWPVSCIGYDLQKDASMKWVDLDRATVVAARAFQAWSSASCPTSGAHPSLEFRDMGPVVCAKHEYNDQQHAVGGNANIIMFRDGDWDVAGLSDSASTLALTTLTFNLATGEIYDADIEINGSKPISADDVVRSDAYDLESILTHEIGHFLGLAHSPVSCPDGNCPTMNALYSRGSQDFRTLEPDDVQGICSVYPVDRQSSSANCQPSHGFSGECGEPAAPKKKCSVAAVGQKETGGAVALALGLALVLGARQRRAVSPRRG